MAHGAKGLVRRAPDIRFWSQFHFSGNGIYRDLAPERISGSR